MKRKRRHRAGDGKGKEKKLSKISKEQVLPVDEMVGDDMDQNGSGIREEGSLSSKMEIESPSCGESKPDKPANTDAEESQDKPVRQSGHARLRVKVKSSKSYTHSHTSLEMQNQSDTDKSYASLSLDKHNRRDMDKVNPSWGLDKQNQSGTNKSNPSRGFEKHFEALEKSEENTNLPNDVGKNNLEKPSRKAGSIKIKSSRKLGPPSGNLLDKDIDIAFSPQSQSVSENTEPFDSSMPGELCQSERMQTMERHKDHSYNQKELGVALAVLKKVMKMEAAEPFNIPVNAEALGIPDYFDVIKTPMDFGTICDSLEQGTKYMNSQDVFKDVQIIWDNCYRYNSKGDYILDLMKRVKKSFTKYWAAAGLSCERTKRVTDSSLDRGYSAMEVSHQEDENGFDKISEENESKKTDILGDCPSSVEDVGPSSKEKTQLKGNSSKSKARRRYGISHHKVDCLCAVCVMKRRRQEREGNRQSAVPGTPDHLPEESNKVKIKSLDKQSFEKASSNIENSLDHELDAEQEVKIESSKHKEEEDLQKNQGLHKNYDQVDSPKQLRLEKVQQEFIQQSLPERQEDSDHQLCIRTVQQAEAAAVAVEQREKQQEEVPKSSSNHLDWQHVSSLFTVNPKILHMGGLLFSRDPKSVWNGPHSLVPRQAAASGSAIHAAIAKFME
ncbi:hypothetical protein AMTRI_Chr11g157800 [Amborella trichopoda]